MVIAWQDSDVRGVLWWWWRDALVQGGEGAQLDPAAQGRLTREQAVRQVLGRELARQARGWHHHGPIHPGFGEWDGGEHPLQVVFGLEQLRFGGAFRGVEVAAGAGHPVLALLEEAVAAVGVPEVVVLPRLTVGQVRRLWRELGCGPQLARDHRSLGSRIHESPKSA